MFSMNQSPNKFIKRTSIATAIAIACANTFTPALAQETAHGTAQDNVQKTSQAIEDAAPENAGKSAVATAQLGAIEKVSNEILKTEIQVMKLSAGFHAAWLKPNRWKSWRVFAYKIADSGMTNAGMTTIAASRFEYADDPSRAPRSYLKAGHIINLTAASILVGGTLTETLLDRIAECKLARKKFDPKSALTEFLRLRKRLDDLLAERSELAHNAQTLTQYQKELLDADGLVLRDLRELVSNEFNHAYCEVARFRGVRDASNATALFSGAAAGYMGSLQSLLSVANRHPHQTGVAGLGFITSGSSVAATPLIVKFSGHAARSGAAKKLHKHGIGFPDSPKDQFDVHRARFEQLVSAAPPAETSILTALNARSTIYRLHNEIIDARDQDRLDLKRKSNRDLVERLFFSSIIGGTNIARGAQLVVAGFHYGDVPKENFKLVASASTAYIAGSAVWTADNIQSKVREELLERKIKAGKLSVHGKLLRDLEDLQQMEDQISVY